MSTRVDSLAPFVRRMPHAARALSDLLEFARELPEGEDRTRLGAMIVSLMAGLAQDVPENEPAPR